MSGPDAQEHAQERPLGKGLVDSAKTSGDGLVRIPTENLESNNGGVKEASVEPRRPRATVGQYLSGQANSFERSSARPSLRFLIRCIDSLTVVCSAPFHWP